jgi:DNA-binding transcriptional MerR regulator
MSQEEESPLLRIGELSRRVGVSEHVLRAWETRYGLLKPARSEGGYRLYSTDDQSRVRRMQVHLAGGLAAAQAAQAVLARESPSVDVAESAAALRRALDELDEPEAQGILDRLLTELTVESVLRDVVVPYLHELGDRWEQGVISVGQEHFASNVLRGRLSALARGWGGGRGPQALLACPPNEQHDLGLLVFGIVLHRCGWRVEYLGANTPMLDTIQVTSQIQPGVVVMAATRRKRFAAVRPELMAVAELAPLVLAGAGATTGCAYQVGARALLGDPVTEAELLAGS